MQHRLWPRQIAPHRSAHRQQQRLLIAGNRRQHIALHLGIQCQRRAGQQAGFAFVLASSQLRAIELERMACAIKLVAARHIGSLLSKLSRHAQRVNRKGHVHLKRQQQVVQRGRATVRALVIDVELRHVQRVKLQPAVQKRPGLPRQIDLAGFNDQPVFLPAQQANVPALAQCAPHVFCHQHLPGWQIA